MTMLGLALFGSIAGAHPALAEQREPGEPAADIGEARAQSMLEQLLTEDGGSGVMAAVFRDGELVWHGEAGFADIEAVVPLAANHRLRIGSISKLLTAALLLRLHEQGLFDLDADVRDYLPELGEQYNGVTVRQLARHLGGVRHYDFGNFAEANNVRYFANLWTANEWLAQEPLLSVPGEQFEYSSLGYNLIGAAIEAHLGKSFAEVVQEQLTGPLALVDTFPNDTFALVPRRTGFYTVTVANPVMDWMRDGELINTFFRDDSDIYPSGGLLSNAIELAHFGDRLFAGEYLLPMSLAEMTEPSRLADGSAATLNGHFYGLGTLLYSDGGTIYAYGHGGLTNGGTAEIVHYPEAGVTIAVIANYNSMGATAFDRLVGHDLPTLFVPGA